MAKLSAHGQEIGRFDLLTKRLAYMADGKILVNHGQGWKLHAKLKVGIDPLTAVANMERKQASHREQFPNLYAYIDAMHDLVSLNGRWKVHATIQLMPDDPDGVCTTLADDYGHDRPELDLDDCVKLCGLYSHAKAIAESVPA